MSLQWSSLSWIISTSTGQYTEHCSHLFVSHNSWNTLGISTWFISFYLMANITHTIMFHCIPKIAGWYLWQLFPFVCPYWILTTLPFNWLYAVLVKLEISSLWNHLSFRADSMGNPSPWILTVPCIFGVGCYSPKLIINQLGCWTLLNW